MLPFFGERYANPSGAYAVARRARRAVDDARDQVADALGVRPDEVIFTGGGTESDNTVIKGVDGIAVCSAVEHHGVLHPVEHGGGRVVGVDSVGRLCADELVDALDDQVAVVSVMAVNNEVGTINDLGAIAEIVADHAPRALVHTDAVQAAPWLDLAALANQVDSLSLSAHKFGGPQGIGVLTVRRGIALSPLIEGGGQEAGLRSGTHNVAGIVGLAAALGELSRQRDDEVARIRLLRDRLVDEILAAVPDARETVDRRHKVAGSAHLLFRGVESESLLFLLDQAGVAASAGSACSSGAIQVSHVVEAMGIDREWAAGSLRLSLGHTTTAADIDHAVVAVVDAVAQLRRDRS